MFERPNNGEQALLIHVELNQNSNQEDLQEFKELVQSSGTIIAGCTTAKRHAPDAKYFIGKGKVEEIANQVAITHADIILFNNALSPSQERNLEKSLQCRVLDRTTLILDIFAQRAHSFEGKLQVELAQLRHLSTRLIRGWTHLERQKGGIGLRGPGETQLETDRRLLGLRIKQIKKRLEKVRGQRNQSRRARNKADIPTVSLVGYTNAGKSTLFNQLTGANIYAANQLFATLDPTLRCIELPNSSNQLILADTVGFIRHLPHDLVEAFNATLQETSEADLLLHIVDASHPEHNIHIQQVNHVLKEIEATDIPQIMVFNKIDLLDIPPKIDLDEQGNARAIWLSAKNQLGIELLLQQLSTHFHSNHVRRTLRLPPSAGKLRANLFNLGHIIQEQNTEEGGWLIEIDLPRQHIGYLDNALKHK